MKPSAALSHERLQQLALRYLTGRDRTEAQLTAYLLRKGASPERLRPLLHRFRVLGYLNDDRFALQWAEARLRAKPMARRRLELELRGRGISRVAAGRTLEQLYAQRDEADLARLLLAQRCVAPGRLSSSTPQAYRRDLARTIALLQRHGFGPQIIRAVLGEGAKMSRPAPQDP
jgi:regulatory protein